MHVSFLIRSLGAGGAERTAVSLASDLIALGHSATLFVLTGNESFYAVDPLVQVVFLSCGDTDDKTNLPGFFRRVSKIRRAVRAYKPNVLVGMSAYMSVYAMLAVIGTKTSSIGTERANPFVLYADRKTSFLRKGTALCCRGFVCQTERARSFFPKAVQKKAAVIPNAVHHPLLDELTIPEQREPTVTAVGRLDRNKGFDLLLQAFAVVHEAKPAYTLIIFGDGPCLSALEQHRDALGLKDCVRFPGADPEALRVIAASSVFVLSSRSEGMPNALMEAMAVGVPCVSTDCDMGPAELITDGVNGILVPTEDPDALTAGILRVLDDPVLSDSLSKEAVKIREKYRPQVIAEQWIQYFVKILQ